MWRSALDSMCVLCRLSTAPMRPLATPIQPWLVQRSFATRQTRRPSRMVLSDRVDRPPPSRTDPTKRPRRRTGYDGPFGGMNRTVANIEPPKARAAKPETRDRGGRRGKDSGGRDTRKALKMQRALHPIGYGHRTRVKADLEKIESFDQFDLLPEVKEAIGGEALKGMVDIKPTPVQKLAVPALLGQKLPSSSGKRTSPSAERKEFLLAAETGSGKTLAYLLPCINALKKGEIDNAGVAAYNQRLEAEKEKHFGQPLAKWVDKFEPHPNKARPRVVVLVPTAELVDQVTSVAKSIAHVARLKIRPISATFKPMKIQESLYHNLGVDMVVATPHLLAAIAVSDPNVLSRVSHLVIDEADSLLDRSFSPETTKILERAMPSLEQLVLCSATIPKRLDTYLEKHFPNIQRITTPNLHAIPRRIQLGVIDVSKEPYRNNKLLACADAIWTIGKDAASQQGPASGETDVKRIMVFVNERETTKEVADYLTSRGVDAVALNRDTLEHRQSEMLASFTTKEPMRVVPTPQLPPGKGRRLPNTKVIVATDLASRGIDTLAVRHVVLYDVPHTTIDFIHRLGRAGRMGRRGRGIVLVGKDDRRDVVSEVRESMYMGQALV
ncbi:P-loop containing nucleoside triphosphate hydrolase protein [Thozetella sp. PMI_491]|nr:P-loop containing nucleoside triphosphate hydrolase protein [Thozetella sp. PMI_491]